MKFETILGFFIAIFAGVVSCIAKAIGFSAKAGYKWGSTRYREDHRTEKNAKSNSMLFGAGVAAVIVVALVGIILLISSI